MLADAGFNLVSRPLEHITVSSYLDLMAKRYLDYRYLYAWTFLLLADAFPCLLMSLESYLFLFLSVIFCYSSIKITNLRHISVLSFYPLFPFRMVSNSILTCSSLFYFRVISNSISPCRLFFYFRVASNSIPPYAQQLRICRISSSLAADNIFLVKSIYKIIKPITQRVR